MASAQTGLKSCCLESKSQNHVYRFDASPKGLAIKKTCSKPKTFQNLFRYRKRPLSSPKRNRIFREVLQASWRFSYRFRTFNALKHFIQPTATFRFQLRTSAGYEASKYTLTFKNSVRVYRNPHFYRFILGRFQITGRY
jgi:hypothetical protein